MSERPEDTDDTALAGEYVLGLLDGDARAAFEARLAVDPALRARVRDWAEDLAPLTEGVETPPPTGLQARIEARLFSDDQTVARPGGRLRGWLLGALTGAVAALGVVLLGLIMPRLLDPPPAMPRSPALTAQIAAEDASLVIRAAYDAGEARLYLEREAGAARPGRVLELWLIAGQAAPVSLGVLPDAARASVPLDAALRDALAGAVLAVSDEPPGGSPTGAPTGDVLALGQVTDT